MSKPTDTELEKSKPYAIGQLLKYMPNSVLTTSILKKITGNITLYALDTGEEIAKTTLPFDTFVQLIDGSTDVIIDDKKIKLSSGDGMVIPAHSPRQFSAGSPFKMLSTIIKSGYED